MLSKNYFKLLRGFCLLIFLISFTVSKVLAQNTPSTQFSCGQSAPSSYQLEQLKEKIYFKAQQYVSNGRTETKPLTYLPIRIHIIRRTDGTGGVNELEVFKGISALNLFYRTINMQFYVCGTPNYVNNSTFYDFISTNEMALANAAGESAGVINIYYVNSLAIDGKTFAGYAYYPGGHERILMANSAANNDRTLPHEVGHYFGLPHTFNNSNHPTITERELVTRGAGANCSTKGDFICDTPADPYERTDCGTIQTNCIYTGTCKDANGATFTPPFSNIMSYYFCRGSSIFTSGQYNVMATAWETAGMRRDYTSTGRPLSTGCTSATLSSSPILSSTTTCNSSGLTLNWSNITNELGYFIERSSDNGNTFNSIGTVPADVTTFKDITAIANKTYQYRVKPINSSANFSNTINVTTCLIYCNPKYAVPCYRASNGVTLGINSFSTSSGITNISSVNTGCSSEGYGDFTAISGTFATNSTIAYSISNNIGGACFNQNHAIWIDFNRNGIFEGTSVVGVGSEMVAQTMTPVVCSFNGSFTIPSSVTAGSYRMRVRSDGSSPTTLVTSPCDNIGYGETEDYTVIITNPNASGSITLSSNALTAFSSCVGSPSTTQSYTVSATNLTANLVITAPTGFEVSTTSGSGFASSVTLTQTSGTVANSNIFVRQTSSAPNGASGNITHTSTGATAQNKAIPASTVNPIPTISVGTIAEITTTATSFSLPYTATGSPNQYSITTGVNALAGFSAVSNASLSGSPLTVNIPPSAAGTYRFNLTVRNSATGCTSSSVPFTITVKTGVTTGIEDPILSAKLLVFPNPLKDKLTLELGLEKLSKINIKLVDVTGKIVLDTNISPKELKFKQEIDFITYSQGVYTLLLNVDGKTAVKRLVKE